MSHTFAEKLSQLEQGTLPPEGFTHRDHVGVAMEALRHYEFFEATQRYAAGLRKVVEKAGVPEKYNATVTLAFMSLIAERMGQGQSVDAFLKANPDLSNVRTVVSRFDKDRLGSDLARRVALLPN